VLGIYGEIKKQNYILRRSMTKKMKKRLYGVLVFIIVLLMISGLYGCSSQQEETGTPEEENPFDTIIDAQALAEHLFENITFADELTKVDNDIAYEIYGMEKDVAKDIAVYMSTGATAEEIAVFTVSSDNEALLVSTAFNSRIEQQKSGFENYVPEELPKLEKAVITQIDSAVVMIVCNDTDEANEAVGSYIETYLQ